MQERELKMFKTLKKYLSIYAAMFKASVISDLEYRVNFLTRIVSDIFWYLAQIATFEVLYLHTPKIGDWKGAKVRMYLGLNFGILAL